MPDTITKADLTAALAEQTKSFTDVLDQRLELHSLAIGEKIDDLADHIQAVDTKINRILNDLDYLGHKHEAERRIIELARQVGRDDLATPFVPSWPRSKTAPRA